MPGSFIDPVHNPAQRALDESRSQIIALSVPIHTHD